VNSIKIRLLATFPDLRWNDYVDRHPAGTFFHLSEWAAVYAALSWTRPYFLIAERDAQIVGVMPLAAVHWGARSMALVSSPYCAHAGAIADDDATRAALEDAALVEAQACRAGVLEVRQFGVSQPSWLSHTNFATFSRELTDDDAANLAAVPRHRRAVIRKGEAAGLRSSADIALQDFYSLYCTGVRNLGTPAYPRQLFIEIVRQFGARCGLLAVFDAQSPQPMAAVMSFYYKQRVMPYYSGSRPQARLLFASDYMYWALMRDAAERGCRDFDFGRSIVGSGAAAYKKNWGFKPQALCYQFAAPRGGRVEPLNPDSRINVVARRVWARVPLVIANRIGPWLARRLY